MPLPIDYAERVYAGVLGKIIGVYLGRPFEGWTYDRIMAELGEVNYFVHEKRGTPLIVADDDISGTFSFLRALPDYDHNPDLTPEQIGQTWLNYLIERRTVLWWGGMGNSTEHTAYLRLKHGVRAPDSGSIAVNGKVVAEQIGAQIFIDGWGMVAPGDPERAADLAKRAASVSHDGEAVYGAQVIAAIESLAFLESNIDTLLDTAVRQIPPDSIIARMIGDIREWHNGQPDWRRTREKIAAIYGYEEYGGNCHIVPNHGLIIHALLHGEGDFQKSLMIVNTCGWDTDCNSGNVGCILGICKGLAGIETGPDWRGPVADRMYLPTADGGRCITDAVREAVAIANIGRALAGEPPFLPKSGARFHFSFPGSVQGFHEEDSAESRGILRIENAEADESGSLALHYQRIAPGRVARAATATFLPPETLNQGGYGLTASPTLYPGQTVRASVRMSHSARTRGDVVALYARYYDRNDQLARLEGPEALLSPGDSHAFTWRIPEIGACPIAEIGIEIRSDIATDGLLYLDYLTWTGAPDVSLTKPQGGHLWKRAWVDAMDHAEHRPDSDQYFRLIQDKGTGLLIYGCREWKDYRVSATINPHMVKSVGLAARVQGLRRYYALLLHSDGTVKLVKALEGELLLAETDLALEFDRTYRLMLEVVENHIRAYVGGTLILEAEDNDAPLSEGAIALVCEEGRTSAGNVRIEPVIL